MRHGGVPQMRLLVALALVAAGAQANDCTQASNCCSNAHCTCSGYLPGNPGATPPVVPTQGTCACTGGWTGGTCRTDPCSPNPCSGHATCSGNAQCTCKDGWKPAGSCDKGTGCDSSPCQHSGTCTATGGSHKCDCAGTGYTGDQDCSTGVQCAGLPQTNGVDAPTEHDGANSVAGHYPSTMKYPACPKKCGLAGLICHEQHLVGDPTWKCSTAGTYEDTSLPSQPASETLTCEACPGITNCKQENVVCESCGTIRIIGDCHSECLKCPVGYTDGKKHKHNVECKAVSCDPLDNVDNELANGKITYSVNPPVYSGPSGTTATLTCATGYGLSYDGIKVEPQKPTTCQTDRTWTHFDENAHNPSCEPTCALNDGLGLCVAGQGTCKSGSDRKFLCTCALGWQGEKCDQQVHECKDSGYTTVGDTGCGGSLVGGYALAPAAGTCEKPYWVDETTKLPSGCDRADSVHRTGALITSCDDSDTSTARTWTCGQCSAPQSCCKAAAPNLPLAGHAICDVSGDTVACPSVAWEVPGCTTVADAAKSTVSVDTSDACPMDAGGSTCTCKDQQLTKYSPAAGTRCIPANKPVQIQIEPKDLHGRPSAENTVTTASTFTITVTGSLRPGGWPSAAGEVTDTRTRCSNAGTIGWQQPYYTASFVCNIAGMYTLTPKISGADATTGTQVTIVPQRADPSSTLAFLSNQDSSWCDQEETTPAPRCRTQKDQSNQVLVIVRDAYGNPRPGSAGGSGLLAGPSGDFVSWTTSVLGTTPTHLVDAGCKGSHPCQAPWQDAVQAYVVDFKFTEQFDFAFLLDLKVNHDQDGWDALVSPAKEAAALKNEKLPLWSKTNFIYALFTSLDSDSCKTNKCDEYYLNPLDDKTGEAQFVNQEACSMSVSGNPGCLFHAGLDSVDTNEFQVLGDWGVTGDVTVAIDRVCKNETARTNDGVALYWEGQKACKWSNDKWDWKYTDSVDVINVTQPASATDPSSWPGHRYNGTVKFNTKHPGVFKVKVTFTPTGGSPFTATSRISVGPGPVSPENSHLRLQYIDVSKRSGAVGTSKDWGKGGPTLANTDGTSNSAFTPKLKLWIDAKDHTGNPRIGTDEVSIQLTRPSSNDKAFLKSSARLQLPSKQDFVGGNSYSYTWLTTALPQTAMACKGACHNLPYGSRINGTYVLAGTPVGVHDPAPVFSFKEFGVYQLSAWICEPNDPGGACAKRLPTRLLSNFREKPTYNFTVCPSNTMVPDFRHDELFDPNSRDPDFPGVTGVAPNEGSRGALTGAHLEVCECEKGFSGVASAGDTCYACAAGKFISSVGKAGSCQQCNPGLWCGCSSNANNMNINPDDCKKHSVDWGPACTTCDACEQGKYQNQPGKGSCHTCQTNGKGTGNAGDASGFYCPAGASFPIAKPGYWVSFRTTVSADSEEDGALQLDECKPVDEQAEKHFPNTDGNKVGVCPKSLRTGTLCTTSSTGEVMCEVTCKNADLSHGFAWCPGSPLVGWTLDSTTGDYTHNYGDQATGLPSIDSAVFVQWVDSWDEDFGTTAYHQKDPDDKPRPSTLSEKQQLDCWKGSHENGFLENDPCLQVLGSRCRMGHKTVEGRDKPCSVCCEKGESGSRYPNCDGQKWYMSKDVAHGKPGEDIAYCFSCGESQAQGAAGAKDLIIAGFFAIVVAGLLIKYGVSLADKFKELKPPMMTLITFMQVVNLFASNMSRDKADGASGGGLHWPSQWQWVKDFFSGLGGLFNFAVPDWLTEFVPELGSLAKTVNPACVIALPYWQKWMLWMLSPWLLLLALNAYYYLRVLLAKSAIFMQDTVLDVRTEKCERCVATYEGWVRDPQGDLLIDDLRSSEPHPEPEPEPEPSQDGGVSQRLSFTREPEPEGIRPNPVFDPISRAASPERSQLDLTSRVQGGAGRGGAQGGGAMSRTVSPDRTQHAGLQGGEGQVVRWYHPGTNEEIYDPDWERPRPHLATFRLQGGGRPRWCKSCKIDHERITDDVLVDATEVQLPGCLQCLEGKAMSIPCTHIRVYADTVLPTLVLVCGSVLFLGVVGWIGGTLFGLSTTFGLPFTDKLDVGFLSGEVAVALKGATCLLLVPLLWAGVYFAAVDSRFEMRPWLKTVCCRACFVKCTECCDKTALSKQLDQEFETNESWLAPRQLLNRAVLEPLANSPEEEQLSKINSVWHGYLWFGLINLVTVAVEPLACAKNPYGQYFMSASGAESIECNWCTNVRDFKDAFPRIGAEIGPFDARNGYGLFGLGGLFTVIPLQGYPLLASMSTFCSVSYFIGIPLYFAHKVHVNRERTQDRKFEYAFLTDKMKQTYPWWEVNVMVRKGTLALFSVFSAGHPIASTLANLVVTITAMCLQFWKAPYAHDDMNRVEDWSLVCTCFVLIVGLGGQAAGKNYVDQDTLDWINDVALIVLAMHFLHTFRVLLNRLSRSVWLIRETGGCGCGSVGATVAGLVVGGGGGFIATVLFSLYSFVHTDTDTDAWYSWPWGLSSRCDLDEDAYMCFTKNKPDTKLLIAISVGSAGTLGLLFFGLATLRLCQCCNRRGQSCCCIQTLLCSRECTFPCFAPCCCAPGRKGDQGCCNSQRCVPIRKLIPDCGTDDCACCEASAHEDDSGDYRLDSLDEHNDFQEHKVDQSTMGNQVRKALNKNKLALVDVWVSHGVESEWEDMDASELLALAKTRLFKQMKDKTDDALWKELHKELATVRSKQKSRLEQFDAYVRDGDNAADTEEEKKKKKDREWDMRQALNLRFKNEAINILRSFKQADVTRVTSKLTEEYQSTKDIAEKVTEVLEYFPEDMHWQRVVYSWMTREYEEGHKMHVSKADKAILIDELVNGMKSTATQMRKELVLNQTITTAGNKAVKWLTVSANDLRKQYEVAAGLAEHDGSDSDDSAAELRISSIARGSQLPDEENTPFFTGPGKNTQGNGCCAKCTACWNTCSPSGPMKVFLLVLFAASLGLVFVVYNFIGCCGGSITSLTEHFDEAVQLCDGLDDKSCTTKWADTYNLEINNCPNLQRTANCTISCKEGSVWSNADLSVGRSKIFTCGGGDDWNLWSWLPFSLAPDPHAQFLAKFRTPKWHFVNWPAETDRPTGPENDTATCHDKSWFTDEQVCAKKQAHPHCWADPCYSSKTKDNSLWTACGNNTRCDLRCMGGAKPSVQDKSGGGAPLCGLDLGGDSLQPYNVKYPSQKNCSCYDNHYVAIKDSQGNPDWTQGCRETI